MKILVATDAWQPQRNGVVRALQQTSAAAARLGVTFEFLTPQEFATVPMPGYPEIPLSLARPSIVAQRIRASGADHIHIATEGPLGFLARGACLEAGRRFTTSYLTKFPEYIAARMPVPQALSYAVLRWFHNAGAGVMVVTDSMERDLRTRGFRNVMRWTRGVDADLFRPRLDADLGLKRPVFLYVGRVAVEKNVEAFLALDLPGTKLVVGDGPSRATLERRYPEARFVGAKDSDELAIHYAGADVLVFPSRTDVFGNVMLEALASGVPVAAFPVAGPLDVIGDEPVGVLDEDLRRACLAALEIPRERCREFALRHSWEASARLFVGNAETVVRRAG
ncbi:glycosyltransferase family 4 protein [Blastochloris viridis]|nr:glycosyltransferase family 1 protein [Blastochloris viridis]ALK08741.1 GDP-mannose-dependent alpha-mannosyltransferase [Blastochloris viridis]CUU41402.1 GDP-mannose-dependent alpha-mannosyltransferase [Blastochloris viridis]